MTTDQVRNTPTSSFILQIVTIAILVTGMIFGIAKGKDDFFMGVAVVIIAVLILTLAIAMGRATRIGLIVFLTLLIVGSGWVLLINAIFDKIGRDNMKGPITWPIVTFLAIVFMAFLIAFAITYNRNAKWVFPFMLSCGTFIYALFSSMTIWFGSTSLAITVTFVLYMLSPKVKEIEEKSRKQSILSGLIVAASISTTTILILTMPATLALATSESWWEFFASLGGVISTTWLTFESYNMFRIAWKKRVALKLKN